jgi:hypothetical protein
MQGDFGEVENDSDPIMERISAKMKPDRETVDNGVGESMVI